MESIAPPSISHLSFELGSRMYRRSPVSLSRDAAEFTSVVPLFRFPPGCRFAVVWLCIGRQARS